jgi:hypothetical protein
MPASIARCCCSRRPDVHLRDVTVKTSLDGKVSIDLEASAAVVGQGER